MKKFRFYTKGSDEPIFSEAETREDAMVKAELDPQFVSDRPSFVAEEHLRFLDSLRDSLQDSGITNMFGAASYLQREFEMPKRIANLVLIFWMETFSDRHAD